MTWGISLAIADYQAMLEDGTEERRFLEAIPWTLDAGPQDPGELVRSLRDEAARLARLPRRPVFSLLTAMYNTPARLLQEVILSARTQAYPHWELLLVDDGSTTTEHLALARSWSDRDPRIRVIEGGENRGISAARNLAMAHATGDFVAILDHDDVLHPRALGCFARSWNEDPDLSLMFSNECQMDDAGTRTYGYFYKTHFDLFTILRANYVCHFTAIRRDLVLMASRGGRVFRSEYDGAEDHDLFLRVALTGGLKALHVPLFLYYWRASPTSCSTSLAAKPEIPARRLRLLEELLPEIYSGGEFSVANSGPGRGVYHVSIHMRSSSQAIRPTLLVVAPISGDLEKDLRSLGALENQRHALDVTVVVVGPSSRPPSGLLMRWLENSCRLSYRFATCDEPFEAAGWIDSALALDGDRPDLLLSLAPGIELESPETLQTLAMHLLADDGCGAVGIKVSGVDGRVRHGGLKVLDEADGSGYGAIGEARLPRDFVDDEHVVLGVSFACAMIRRGRWDELGGLRGRGASPSYEDMAFCLRAIEAGYRNHYFGTLKAIDHGPDRGPCPPDREIARAALWDRHGATLANWRLRLFVHPTEPIWPLAPAIVEAEPGVVPLRHRLVDRLNEGLKRVLGPGHAFVKRQISRPSNGNGTGPRKETAPARIPGPHSHRRNEPDRGAVSR